MSEDVADAVIRFMNSGKVNAVSFFGGEPLCNWPTVQRILARTNLGLTAKGPQRTRYHITTNGTLLTEDVLQYLQLHQVHINLSFDGTKKSQDYWRGGTYDAVMKNIDGILRYPSLQVLKTCSDPTMLYDDMVHIKDLGFRGVYINPLDPFAQYTLEEYNVDDFKQQYRRVMTELRSPTFQIGNYDKWLNLIKQKRSTIGCGFSNRGLCTDWEGNLWPCHQGPSLPKDFIIGDIWNGVDEERAKKVRAVDNAPACTGCGYRFSKCYVSMYNKHGRFGVDPPQWYMDFELAAIQVIEELEGLTPKHIGCTPKDDLLIGTLISKEKYYLLKPFLESIQNLQVPENTDYALIVDDDANRLHMLLMLWSKGAIDWLPDPREKFRSIKILKLPTNPGENYMFRIARGRNMVLGLARGGDYSAYWFIDADIITPPDSYEKLNSVDAGLVGGLVKCRRDHIEGWYNNYVKEGDGYTSKEFYPGEIIDVDATGSDCILIRRPVFVGQTYEYKPEIPEAEDMGFCIKAAARGFKVKIHTGVMTKHIIHQDIKLK